jgi:hypothetical protein
MPPKPSPEADRPQQVIGFTVLAQGHIPTMPTKFHAATNELVLWVVANTSGSPVTVSLQNFLLDNKPVDIQPLLWLISNTVAVENGKTGLIAGLRNPAYKMKHLIRDNVKYTIHVAADDNAFPPADHDPDGDIKP